MLTKKNYLLISLMFFSFLSYGSMNFFTSQAKLSNGYTDVSVTEARNLIENTTSLFILDVRTQDEYSSGHIPNATLIPHTEILSRQNELPDNKSRPILVYCRSGTRSVIASLSLVDLNYTMVFNMLGGFNAWKEAGFSYESPFIDPTGTFMRYLVLITVVGTFLIVIIVIIRERYFKKIK